MCLKVGTYLCMYVGEGILRGVSIEAEEEAEVDRYMYVRYM